MSAVVNMPAIAYDPGHGPTNPRAGIVGDYSQDCPTPKATSTSNAANHGSDLPGQNLGIAAGSVEWSDSYLRSASSLSPELSGTDNIWLQEPLLGNDYDTGLVP
jgi:hypothetical protein